MNPPWTAYELTVALQFYFERAPAIPGRTSPEIQQLSGLLNRLQSTAGGPIPDKFRNPNSVHMKLMNFLRLDPDYPGRGLQRGSKQDQVIWNRYSSNRVELKRMRDSICAAIANDNPILPEETTSEGGEESLEGRVLTRLHTYRECDPKLVALKKQGALHERGRLVCEVCDFDFEVAYGRRGHRFIECHHTKPLSELQSSQKTRLDDLALLCSNCHRMIHRKRPWLSIAELRRLVRH